MSNHSHFHSHDHSHSHEHGHHHGHHHHSHHHNHNHHQPYEHHLHNSSPHNEGKNDIDVDYNDMDIPEWKQRALSLRNTSHRYDEGGDRTYLDPPFGQTWDTEVSISASTFIASKTESTKNLSSSLTSKPPAFHAHFDCFSGAAGDMMLAACLDAATNPYQLLEQIKQDIRLGIPLIANEFDIQMEKVWKSIGVICATKVNVYSIYRHDAAPVPTPDSSATTTATTNLSIPRNPTAGGEGVLRNLPDIRHLLSTASNKYIPTIVRDRAIETFTELAIAEANTHGSSSIDNVHFHEYDVIFISLLSILPRVCNN